MEGNQYYSNGDADPGNNHESDVESGANSGAGATSGDVSTIDLSMDIGVDNDGEAESLCSNI